MSLVPNDYDRGYMAGWEARRPYREEPCICNRGPEMDGPSEVCPHHGRPYLEWVERSDLLARRIERVRELVTLRPPGTVLDILAALDGTEAL